METLTKKKTTRVMPICPIFFKIEFTPTKAEKPQRRKGLRCV